MTKVRAGCALAILLLNLGVPAQAVVLATYDAEAIEFVDRALVAGSLDALHALGPQPEDPPNLLNPSSPGMSSEPPAFQLEAEHATVTQYIRHSNATVQGIHISGIGEPTDSNRTHVVGRASGHVKEAGPSFEIFVGSAAGGLNQATAEGTGFRLEPSKTPSVGMTSLEDHQDGSGPIRNVARADDVQTGSNGTLVVAGDFTLSLWDIDITLETEGGTRNFASGNSHTPPIGASDDVRLDIEVTAGRLELRIGSDWNTELFVRAASAVAPQGLRALGANQHGAAGLPAPPSEITLGGPLGASFLGRSGDRLQVEVRALDAQEAERFLAEPDRLAAEGLAAEGADGGWGLAAQAGAAAAVLLVGASLAPPTLRRRRLRRLRELFGQGRYTEVAAAARQLRRGRAAGEAGVMAAVALLKGGRLREAERLLAAMERRGQAEPAAREFLGSCIHAVRGETRSAEERLLRCFGHDPLYVTEAVHTPWLEGVLGRPAFRRYVTAAAPDPNRPEAFI